MNDKPRGLNIHFENVKLLERDWQEPGFAICYLHNKIVFSHEYLGISGGCKNAGAGVGWISIYFKIFSIGFDQLHDS